MENKIICCQKISFFYLISVPIIVACCRSSFSFGEKFLEIVQRAPSNSSYLLDGFALPLKSEFLVLIQSVKCL